MLSSFLKATNEYTGALRGMLVKFLRHSGAPFSCLFILALGSALFAEGSSDVRKLWEAAKQVGKVAGFSFLSGVFFTGLRSSRAGRWMSLAPLALLSVLYPLAYVPFSTVAPILAGSIGAAVTAFLASGRLGRDQHSDNSEIIGGVLFRFVSFTVTVGALLLLARWATSKTPPDVEWVVSVASIVVVLLLLAVGLWPTIQRLAGRPDGEDDGVAYRKLVDAVIQVGMIVAFLNGFEALTEKGPLDDVSGFVKSFADGALAAVVVLLILSPLASPAKTAYSVQQKLVAWSGGMVVLVVLCTRWGIENLKFMRDVNIDIQKSSAAQGDFITMKWVVGSYVVWSALIVTAVKVVAKRREMI